MSAACRKKARVTPRIDRPGERKGTGQLRAPGLVLDVVDDDAIDREVPYPRRELLRDPLNGIVGRARARRCRAIEQDDAARIEQPFLQCRGRSVADYPVLVPRTLGVVIRRALVRGRERDEERLRERRADELQAHGQSIGPESAGEEDRR